MPATLTTTRNINIKLDISPFLSYYNSMEEFNSADILEKQNRKKRLAFLEVGMFEASFILIIIIVLFGVLNYFNILSLSAIYPNQLGFLPHQTISSNLNKPGANLQQTSVDYTKNAKNLDAPSYNSDLQQTVINAIFTGFNRNTLETEALGGKMTFVIDSDTIFQSLVPDSSSTATS